MPCLLSVGIYSYLPAYCPSISFSVRLCSFSQKPLVLATSYRCGCFLASNSGHTTLVFCFLRKFQQVLRPLLFLIYKIINDFPLSSKRFHFIMCAEHILVQLIHLMKIAIKNVTSEINNELWHSRTIQN